MPAHQSLFTKKKEGNSHDHLTYLHSGGRFLAQLEKLLIALLDFLIQALVLDLELLKVNEVQPSCQLLLHNKRLGLG